VWVDSELHGREWARRQCGQRQAIGLIAAPQDGKYTASCSRGILAPIVTIGAAAGVEVMVRPGGRSKIRKAGASPIADDGGAEHATWDGTAPGRISLWNTGVLPSLPGGDTPRGN